MDNNILIKSNNIKGLDYLINNGYKNTVKCIYIDPPYNTGASSFSYTDSYNIATWLTFMMERLNLGLQLLKEDGIIFIQIDNSMYEYLKLLSNYLVGKINVITNLILIKNNFQSDAKYFQNNYENILVLSKKYRIGKNK